MNTNRIKLSIPILPLLNEFWIPLADIVARTSYIPHPDVVRKVGGAIFPTVRNSKKRVTAVETEQGIVGMYDDNTTPRWALLWAHGFMGVSKATSKGWTFAHVWPSRADRESYTHLANLVMVPECFASLTDKVGPLTHYLRWHAWITYGWKPQSEAAPTKPPGYDDLSWRYFEPIDDPRGFIREQFEKAKCKRSVILKPLMGFSCET